ncbi:MAG: hypothetical protein KF784_01700 [Fimbriimonadaceae bacterium]|nr:hypothetical protein [Fimbriimonadaceae bacterium]
MKGKSTFLAILAVCFIGQAGLQQGVIYDKWTKNYSTKNSAQGIAPGLDPTQLMLAVAGFREMIAGILWVRADSFFDTGNYDAVLPMIRLVTWLDPHQIDVYSTGMWHIAYNFTDEESRSDRRYVPQALALGEEGTVNNPDTYELFFETGWIWYHKIDDDYEKAVDWFVKAHDKKDILRARRNLLRMAYYRAGRIEDALKLEFDLVDEANKIMEGKDASSAFSDNTLRDTRENNLDTDLVRLASRGYFAKERKDGSFERLPYDVKPPFDVGFSAKVTVESSAVMLIEGTWNVLPVGTRVRVILRDAEDENDPERKTKPAAMIWDYVKGVDLAVPTKLTFMQDQLYVRSRRFKKRIDMSRDYTMYPFAAEKYYIEFYYNPRSAPAHMQDKFGYTGEGFTDKNFLNTEVRPGERVMFTRLEITRDQIKREGNFRPGMETPILKTANYIEQTSADRQNEDLILVPGLRSDAKTPEAPKPADNTLRPIRKP